MSAGSIVIDLLMRTGAFETDTARAEKSLKKLKAEAVDFGKQVGAAVAVAGTALALYVKTQIDAADEAGKAAQKTGVTVESYSALAYAASLADVSNEELTGSLVKLSRQMDEAAGGSESAQAKFTSLGVSITDATGKLRSSDDVLKDLADRFAAMPDGVEKTAAAVDIFGKSGANLIPLLNSGSAGLREMADEAARFGKIIDTDTASAAEEFNDNLTRLKSAADGVALSLAQSLLPSLVEFSEELLTGLRNTNGLIDAVLTLGSINPFRSQQGNLKEYRDELDSLTAARERYVRSNSDTSGIDQAIANAQKKINYLRDLEKQAQLKTVDFGPGNQATAEARRLGLAPSPVASVAGKPAKDKASSVSEAERLIESLSRQVLANKDLSAVEEARLELQKKGYSNITSAQRERILGLAAELDANKALKEEEALRGEVMKARRDIVIEEGQAVEKANAEFNALIKALEDDTPTNKLEKQRDVMRQLAEAYELGRFGAVGSQEAITRYAEVANTALGNVAEKTEEVNNIGKEIGLTFESAFEKAVTSGKDLGTVIDSLIQDLIQLAARTVVIEPLLKAGKEAIGGFDFMSMFSGSGGGGFDLASTAMSFFGFKDGGIAAHGMPVFAGGGVSNTASIFGEAGPEAAVPLPDGRTIPVTLSGNTGGRTIINIIESPGNGGQQNKRNDGNGNEIIDVFVEQIEAKLASSIASGSGPVPTAMQNTYGLNRAARGY